VVERRDSSKTGGDLGDGTSKQIWMQHFRKNGWSWNGEHWE
jgi:hypothetical protein